MSLFRLSLATTALSLFASPAIAQSQTPLLFVAEFEQADAEEERIAEREGTILTLSYRPELAVELTEVPDADVQRDIGVARDAPLQPGTRLYGSSNRRSLFCHILNARMVGSAGTCFRDFDNDSAFEQGIAMGAPGLDSNVMILSQGGIWTGAEFDDRERMRPPVPYQPVPAEDIDRWPARVIWWASVNRVDPEDYPVSLYFGVMDREGGERNVTGECWVSVTYDGEPVTAHIYGNTIDVLGFTEDRDMRFRVRSNPDPVTLGMVYQFETNSAYVALAQARHRRPLPCRDTSIDAVPATVHAPDVSPEVETAPASAH